MLRVVRGVSQLRGRIVARRLDDLPLHDLAPQEERHETLPFGAERARRALQPPLQLRARPWSLRQVRERQCERAERGPGAVALDRAHQPASRRRVDRQLAQLLLDRAIDELGNLVLGENAGDRA